MASSNNRPTPATTQSRAGYRLWQLWRALRGTISPADDAFARRVLTPAEYQLYSRMPRYDQRHTLDVALLLSAEGMRDDEVLAFVLLHDIGKVRDDGQPLGLIWYGIGVLLRRLPAVRRLGERSFEPLRRLAAHETRSVTAATIGGARPAVVAWLTAVAAGQTDPILALFHEADDRC